MYKVFNDQQFGGKKCPEEYSGFHKWPRTTDKSGTYWSKKVCVPCKKFTDSTTGSWEQQCPGAVVPVRYGYPDPNGGFDDEDIYREIIIETLFGTLKDGGKNILVGE